MRYSAMTDGPIILFDAECILCSANAHFVLKHDRAASFRLASVQSAAGADICRRNGIDPHDPASLLVVDGMRIHRDSDGVLFIYERLGWPWRLVTVCRLAPAVLRDPVYRWIARHRYRLFGKRSTCWVAPPEYRGRIL